MTKWIVKHLVPYDGITEYDFDTAAEVVEFLGSRAVHDRENMTVVPAPAQEFQPYEFEEAFKEGRCHD